MIPDYLNRFSDSQAVAATALSTYIVDAGIGDLGPSENVSLFAVANGFEGTGTITVALLTSDEVASSGNALTNPVTLGNYPIPNALVLSNTRVMLGTRIPHGAKRYFQLNYTVGTGFTTFGTIDAGFVFDVQADDKINPRIQPAV